jgi:YggT family protein
MRDVVIQTISLFVQLISFLIIARSLMSFFPVDRNNVIVRLIFELTEPILAPIRGLLPQNGMLDFSPMVAILLLFFVQQILSNVIGRLF